MRVLVCGGRDYGNRYRVTSVLDHYHAQRPFAVVIEGGATGADALAAEWAKSRSVLVETYEAAWDDLNAHPLVLRRRRDGTPYNAAAGAIRNERMLAEGLPDVVIAFPGGSGTANMTKQAKLPEWRVPVLEIPA